MKRLFISLLSIAAMASCVEGGGGDIDVATTREVGYGVQAPSALELDVTSKVAVSSDGAELTSSWSKGERLGGWSSEAVYAFKESGIAGDAPVSYSRFESSVSSSVTKLRLFSPYNLGVQPTDGCYPLDMRSQTVNSAAVYSNVGDYSVMVSGDVNVDAASTVEMRHLGSFVNFAFAMSDFGKVTDGEILGAEIVGLASQGALNVANGALQSVERLPIVVSFDGALSMDQESFDIPVAALPIDFAQGDSLSIVVNYKSAGAMESKRFIYNFEEAFSLTSAMYHQFSLSPVAPAGLELVDGVYQLYSAADLVMFAQKVNEGEGDIDARLMNDIDLSSVCGANLGSWTPIGYRENITTPSGKEYRGTFDGADHKIRGLYIKDMMGRMQGLFGYVDGGVIKNLDLFGSVTSFGTSGGFAGYFKGEIINCINYVAVNGAGNEFGGIAGRMGDDTKVVGCRNMITVKGASLVGGIAGSIGSNGNLAACFNGKPITHGSASSVVWGGIVGSYGSDTELTGCIDTSSSTIAGSGNADNLVSCYASTDGKTFDEFVVWSINNALYEWNGKHGKVLKYHYKFRQDQTPEIAVGEPTVSDYNPRNIVLTGDQSVDTTGYKDKNITLEDDATLTLTASASAVLDGSTVSINSPKARLYLPNIMRGDWAALSKSILIDGKPLSDGVNAQVLGYYDHLYVKSKVAGHTPAILYSGTESAGVVESKIYTGGSIPLGDNKVERIVLERGYQIVVADDVKGIVSSRCYIALYEDLEIVLDAKLKGKVSFLRVVPFSYVTKRGLCGKTYSKVEKQLDLGWYYSWGRTETSTPDLDFVPMFWAGSMANDTEINKVIAKPYTPTVLAFNEPDNKDQSNMTVEKALDCYEKLLRIGVRMGSPATEQVGTTTAWPNDEKWINAFMAGAKERGYRVDFIAIHWYDVGYAKSLTAATAKASVNRLKAHLDACYKKHGLPIWITEFNVGTKIDYTSPTVTNRWQVHQPFMELVVPMLEAHPAVERYAYFPAEANISPFVSGAKPSSIGYSYITGKTTPSIVNPAN